MSTITGDNSTVHAEVGDDLIFIEGNRFEDHWSGSGYAGSGSSNVLSVFNTYRYTGGYNEVHAESGNDTVHVYCGGNTIHGGEGDDIFYIPKNTQIESFESEPSYSIYVHNAFEYENGGNYVHAGSGNDSVYAEGGSTQSIDGGADNDYIRIDDGASCGYVGGGSGDDVIVAYGDYQTLAGDSDNDLIVVQDYGADRNVDGGSGIDTVQLADIGGRADLAAGVHASGDVSATLLNFENAIGSMGAEEISGTGGGNRLEGRGGSDSLHGMDGEDSIYGGDGDDLLNGGAGLDVVDGGLGSDTVSYDFGALGGSINLSTGTALFAGISEKLLDIENATGSYGSDEIMGSSTANVLKGDAGEDTLLGLRGNDTLLGDLGNDTLDGGLDADSMAGGVGNDTYVVDSTADIIVEASAAGTDTVRSSITYGLSANAENLTLTGAVAAGGTGNALANVLIGNGRSNALSAGAGADTIVAGGGNDSLSGGDGADRLAGGLGHDTFAGGAGTDTLVWTANALAGGDVRAGVTERVIGGAGDRLDFTGPLESLMKVGGTSLSGAVANVQIGSGFTAGSTTVRFDPATDFLQFDLNESGTFTSADFQIALPDIATVFYVAAGDYFLLG